jgi:tetratricopeptide (TPR) repeat protein
MRIEWRKALEDFADFAFQAPLIKVMAQQFPTVSAYGGQKMKIKNLSLAFAVCTLLALLTLSASAQVGRIEGDVIKTGTTEPVVGAQVDIVRTDIKGNYPVKTDKKGHFLHAGVPFVGTYTIIISADGCEPTFLAGIRPDREVLKIDLRPGDGRKLTIDDVKKVSGGKPGAPVAGGAPAAAPKMTPEEAKKAKEEYDKAMKEREEAEKFNSSIGQINIKLKEGNDAMAKNDHATAITAFKEAVALNPTIHISHGNLAIALQKRAVAQFNAGQRDAAKQDFVESIAASNKAIEGLDAQEKDTKMKNDPAQNKANRRTYHVVRAESESILAGKFGDGAQAEAAVKDYDVIASLTDDPAEKKKYPLKGANVLFEAGKSDEAIVAYNKILETDGDNIDVLYQLGLAYAGAGKFQDSANTLQRFLDKAPESHPKVTEVKAVIKDLVVGNNLTPPKPLDNKGRAPARKKP